MPTYEYRREDGTKFERVQGINEEALERCPDTGQRCVRLISKNSSGVLVRGWSPLKERKKEEWIRKNPYGTTLPEHQKKIDENTEKAREAKGKAGLI